MPMTHQIKVLRVFLASPSDLEAERKATKEIVERFNHTIREIGWAVELLGWEDRLPGYGRPQAQINEDVDACDLFLGVLWRRWGSPSGKFQSGFEEEFERAVVRRRKSESPEIWIYFKRVDRTSDPGDQLRQVLAFRKKLEQERELLFQQFDDTSEWVAVCQDALFRYVLKRVFPEGITEIQSTASTTAPSRPDGAMQTRLSDTEQGLPEQLRRVFVAIGDAAKEPGSAQFNTQLLALGDVDLVRLHLLGRHSCTKASARTFSRTMLPTLSLDIEKRSALLWALNGGLHWRPCFVGETGIFLDGIGLRTCQTRGWLNGLRTS